MKKQKGAKVRNRVIATTGLLAVLWGGAVGVTQASAQDATVTDANATSQVVEAEVTTEEPVVEQTTEPTAEPVQETQVEAVAETEVATQDATITETTEAASTEAAPAEQVTAAAAP